MANEEDEKDEKGKETAQAVRKKLSYLDEEKPPKEKKEETEERRIIDLGNPKLSQYLAQGVIALVVAGLMVVLMAPLKGDLSSLETKVDTLIGVQNTLALSVDGSAAQVEARVASLGERFNALPDYSAQMGAIQTQLGKLEATIVTKMDSGSLTSLTGTVEALEARVKNTLEDFEDRLDGIEVSIIALEEALEEKEVAEEEDTKWSISADTNMYPKVSTSVHSSPSRIEEEGDYTIKITLSNVSSPPVQLPSVVVTLFFSPQRNDRIEVDDRDIYLESYSPYYILWDVEVTERSDGTCRRIICRSSTISLDASEVLVIDLDFTLEYQ